MSKKRRTALSLLVALPLAALAAEQAQEELQVLVAGDRTAAIRMHETVGDSGLAGDLEASADLAEGSSALRADLRLEDAGDLGDGTVGAFLRLGADSMETIGTVDVPLPAEGGDVPERLDLSFESVIEGDTAHATGRVETAVPSDEPVPAVALDGTMEGSPGAFSGTVDYTVTLPEGQARRIPVTELSLAIADRAADTGDGGTVVTTLTLSVTAPTGSPLAPQLRSASQLRPMIEQQLTQAGLQVERIELPPVEETGETLTAGATVAVRDLRGSLAGFLSMAGPAMVPDTLVDTVDMEAITAPLRRMIEPRVDSLSLTANVDGATVSGTLEGEVSRLEAFVDGYLGLIEMMSENAPAAGEEDGEEGTRFAAALQEANMKQSARTMQVLMDSDLSFRADGQLDLGGAEGTTTVDGRFTVSVEDYGDFAERARAEDLPVAETALGTGDLELTEAGRLEGRWYARSDIAWQDAYRGMILEALADVGASGEATSLVEEADLEDAALSLELDGRDLTVRGYSRTTPLTGASRVVLGRLKPELEGTPVGARASYTFRPDGTGEGEVLVHFADFMPGRSAAEIAEAMGLSGPDAVRMDASSEAVALTRVERPAVEVSDELADVRASARDGLAGGEGGGPNWLLIGGGLLAVALVGLGLAAARRRGGEAA